MSSEIETRVLSSQEQTTLHNAFAQRLGGQAILTAYWQDDPTRDTAHETATPYEITAKRTEDGDVTVSIQRGYTTQSFVLPNEERVKNGIKGTALEYADYGKYDSSTNRDFAIRAHHLGVLALCYKAFSAGEPDSLEQPTEFAFH